ncbi:antagonist of KipI [Paenibacillaceae bacterium GAS479]|nr:antagonist of KipI [Paenibacillaceae bacterium GAS479]
MRKIAFHVLHPGMMMELQDLGRPGWRSQGMPAGGAMDAVALQTANLLCGNERGVGALELTLSGPQLRVEAPEGLLAALCGADMEAAVDGWPLPTWRAVYLPAGSIVAIGRARSGCRAYLAVAGGVGGLSEPGGVSAGPPAGIARRFAAGDALACGEPSARAAAWTAALAQRAAAGASGGGLCPAAAPWLAPRLMARGAAGSGTVLRAVPGAAYGQLSEAARMRLWRERLTASPASDRMGVRLQPDGPPIMLEHRADILSHGVLPGAVQLPPGGAPVVLGAGCQTTGGYPVILHVVSADMPLLAQVRPGDKVRFASVELEEAQQLQLQQEQELNLLDAALRLKVFPR